jgi:hypothetical protein
MFASCDRHKGIIAYLASANLPQSSVALREELGDSITVDDSTLKKYEGLLEKKWTSVVRLQKKVRVKMAEDKDVGLLMIHSSIDHGFRITMRLIAG